MSPRDMARDKTSVCTIFVAGYIAYIYPKVGLSIGITQIEGRDYVSYDWTKNALLVSPDMLGVTFRVFDV